MTSAFVVGSSSVSSGGCDLAEMACRVDRKPKIGIMAVDGSHPGCFVHATKLFAVPSDSRFTVEQTRASFTEAATARRRYVRRISFDRRTIGGGAAGGVFLVASALILAHVVDLAALVLLFAFGGGVGLAAAVGFKQQQPQTISELPPERFPAIEVPTDVALAAPDDATVDELVLWAVLTQRFRAATTALAEVPFENDTPDSAGRPATGTLSASALAELTYVTARHDFEPVAILLGLDLPSR